MMNTLIALSALGFLSQVSASGEHDHEEHHWEWAGAFAKEHDHGRRLSGDDEMTLLWSKPDGGWVRFFL